MTARTVPFADRTLAFLVEILAIRRTAISRCVVALHSEAADALMRRDLSDLYDDDPSIDSDAECTLMLAHRAERLVREIDDALARVDHGTFGYCVDCGDRIRLERLRALPETSRCIICSGSLSRSSPGLDGGSSRERTQVDSWWEPAGTRTIAGVATVAANAAVPGEER